ncbi:MAG: choice-of-anchor Q domain-containing protein [Chloroflexota bacterium]
MATNSTTLTIIKDAGPAIGTDFDFTLTSEPFSNYSGSTSGNPFWTRPNEGGTCTLSTVSTRYHVQAFAVDTSGNYNLSSNQSGWDGYIHLYQDSFNPLAPCTHYLNGDDNVLSSGSSEISSQFLEAGRTYYFVTSGKFSSSAGNFSNSILGVGTVYTLYESFTLDDAVPDDSDGIDASTTFNVSPGTYAVTELPLSGWGLTGATCTGASGSVSLTDNTLSVEVSDGEAVQCTFTNESLCPASWIVTTAAELSVCITLANNNESPSPTADTITLGANITLSTALPQITSEITLEGAGYAVDGGNRGRIFFVNSTGDFTVNQVTLQNGSAYEGGGIYNSGTLTVSNSTIPGNTGGRAGGGIYNINGTLTVSNSTISGNTAGSYGGGIYNQGSLTMNNSTLANNGAFVGGGIANFGTIYLAGNIFATNGDECAGSRSAIYDNGYNLSVSRLCTNGGPGSVTNATLNLGALADNGGPTLTHLPGAGSDAIGAIPNGTTISNNGTSWTCDQSATDQRGVLRPITAGTACTAGAVEVAISICPSWTATTADELYQCIFRANNNESPSPTADTITLGADITLSTALPQITSEITVEGAGYAVDGGGSVQLFFVALDGDFTINQATLQNGVASNGGGIFNRGALIVTNSTFSGNLADIYGGGIYNIGTLTVTNSTFSGNSAVFGGGIANFDANTVMMTSSTFSGNSATVGDGIFTENTVVYIAGNIFEAGASGNNCANFGTLNDNGYNLSDDGTCGFTGTGSANNATLNLSALSGGVHTPQAGSDAIGAIPNGTTISNNGTSWTCDQSATDQRGESRPINSGEDCTAGAVEVARVQLTLQPNGYFSWLPDRSGSCSESLYRSSTPYVGHTWLTDDPANYDGSGSLTDVAINYFYYLLVDCGGSLSQSNEVGEFTFAIVPGG